MEFLLESSHENGICAGAFDCSFAVKSHRNVAFRMLRIAILVR